MDYNIYSKDVTITDSMKDYIDKRFSKVSKVVNEEKVISMDLRLSKVRAFYNVEATAHLPGVVLRVEEKGSDFYTVVDAASDAFERRLKRFKERTRFKHKNGIKENLESVPSQFEEEEQFTTITRRKRFTIKPMTEEEALLQMEMLGHTFFVFRNIVTDEVNVIYTRKNGSLGIIEMNE
ncbi:Ribosomal subunit interface protein [Mesotoga infera]|uniref:Ribosome hibernation promoting factor n=1 Tax=Mesotoga infera TaxID=1236046 RepID=A0A7Z7LG23_9BACT|nr:ribosome-associated translation inhibitor RaiA [Mesotoga infera]SSC12790.1 Ribosomal subunit interface protein [Mesotoga infera]HOI34948.1 ribosome-associated translation inhibitor RaiA [Mesotoga infera]HOI63519.1 ribosome-associated translation inhibitor RaiA [Mesotoga sp.]